jgi:hypothetical protein
LQIKQIVGKIGYSLISAGTGAAITGTMMMLIAGSNFWISLAVHCPSGPGGMFKSKKATAKGVFSLSDLSTSSTAALPWGQQVTSNVGIVGNGLAGLKIFWYKSRIISSSSTARIRKRLLLNFFMGEESRDTAKN